MSDKSDEYKICGGICLIAILIGIIWWAFTTYPLLTSLILGIIFLGVISFPIYDYFQRHRGLIRYKGLKYGTPEQIEKWKQEEFEREQIAKGLIKYKGKWITPEDLHKLKEISRVLKERKEFERKQKERGLVKFIDRHGIERWGTLKQVKEWKRIDLGLRNNFSDFSPREFECFIGELFKRMGYLVEMERYTKDFGIDLVAKKGNDIIVIQVKKWKKGHNIGPDVVRSVLGAMWKVRANKAIIITTSDFTVLAREQAKGAPVELWNCTILERLVEKYFLSQASQKWHYDKEEIRRRALELLSQGSLTLKELAELLGIDERSAFIASLRESKYDSIIDAFLVYGKDIVEVKVEGEDPNFVRMQLDKRIEVRGLRDKVKTSVVNNVLYLEKVR